VSSEAVLLAMQAPAGVPRSNIFSQISDPLLPPSTTQEMLSHFYEKVYDLSPESHLSRLLKVLLGDPGAGQLRKRYTYAHLSQFVLTAHFNDLDLLYASIFGLTRFVRERLNLDPYTEAATDAEWEAISAADASYRNRVAAFSRALQWAGTPNGMVIGASAVLGDEVRVYENYEFIDNEAVYTDPEDPTTNTWGDLEGHTWGYYDGRTWGSMEGGSSFTGRSNSRGEFTIRPLRTITDEERYHLTKVMTRIKPAKALMTIDARPAVLHIAVPVHRAVASSDYWHIQSKVQVNPKYADSYARSADVPVEQPRYAFSAYQGEAWAYNSDVVTVASYVEDEDGQMVQNLNYERVVGPNGETTDYKPGLALQSPEDILRGRMTSDGIISAPVAVREAV
jgi:hypothetical protein